VNKNTTRRLALVTLLLGPIAPDCVGKQAPETNSAVQVGQDQSGQPSLQVRDWRYRLHPADSFTISFPLTSELNQDATVQPDGYVTLKEVGEILVAGKSLAELRDLVRASYSKIISPQLITIELKDFEKPYFLVGGEVEHPGKFEIRNDTTVAEAVAIAGGFKDSAKHSQVLLFRRVSDQWMEAKKLDLKKMLKEGNLSEDLHLRPGDMVYVPKNAVSKIKPFLPVPTFGAYTPVY